MRVVLLAALAILLQAGPVAAQSTPGGDCTRTRLDYSETARSASASWRIRQGTTCRDRFNRSLSDLQASGARNGTVRVEGSSFSYRPNPGFVGTDGFDLTFTVPGRHGEAFPVRARVTVDVVP